MSLVIAKPVGGFVAPGDQDRPVATAIIDASYGTDLLLEIGVQAMGTAVT